MAVSEQPPVVILLSPDMLIHERYRIVHQIGKGNMGAVYEAIDERLSQTVALKHTLARGEQFRKAFEHEAKILAELRHPVLPRVIDYFTDSSGQFMVMDYFPDQDLGELLHQRGSPFLVEAVLKWADQVLHALEYLHRQQPPVIHCDIKPQNLKLTSEGQIVLLDFGLARGKTRFANYHMTATATSDTMPPGEGPSALESDTIHGFTRQYAPLEQIQGTAIDPRTDVYALAATLYHLLTGSPPVDALTRIYALGYDAYSHYETGMERLLEQIDDNAREQRPSRKQAFATYDDARNAVQQLRENIAMSRDEGSTAALQEERADLFDKLDEISRAALDVSFNKLCRLHVPGSLSDDASALAHDTMPADPLIPAHEVNTLVPVAVGEILHKALSLDADNRHTSAESMRMKLQRVRRELAEHDDTQDAEDEDLYADEPFLPPHPPKVTPPRPRKKVPLLLIIIILVVLVVQIILMVTIHQAPPEALVPDVLQVSLRLCASA